MTTVFHVLSLKYCACDHSHYHISLNILIKMYLRLIMYLLALLDRWKCRDSHKTKARTMLQLLQCYATGAAQGGLHMFDSSRWDPLMTVGMSPTKGDHMGPGYCTNQINLLKN